MLLKLHDSFYLLVKKIRMKNISSLIVLFLLVVNFSNAAKNRYGMNISADGSVYVLDDAEKICSTVDCSNLPDDAFQPYVYSEESIKAIDYSYCTTSTHIFKDYGTYTLNMEVDIPVLTEGPHPFLIYVHGGSWYSGSPVALKNQSQYLASRGIAGVRITYTLVNNGGHFDMGMQELDDAFNYISAHADEWNLDMSRFGYVGNSAGAPLAALKAMQQEGCKLLIGYNGLYDFTNNLEGSFPAEGNKYLQFYEQIEDRENISAVNHIPTTNIPATTVFHGTADYTIAYKQAEAFVNAIQNKGGSATQYIYENYVHGFFNKGSSDVYEDILIKTYEAASFVFNIDEVEFPQQETSSVYYVSPDGDDLTNTGVAVNSPFQTIKKVFDLLANTSQDEVFIKLSPGVYGSGIIQPNLGRPIKIVLSGESASNTIIERSSGTRLFYLQNSLNAGLDFTIENVTIRNYGVYTNNYPGNVLMMNSLSFPVKVKFSRCVFKNNISCRAAILQSSHKDSEVIFENCYFEDCKSFDFGGAESNFDAIIYISAGSISITNCIFKNNTKDPLFSAGVDRDLKKGTVLSLHPKHGTIKATIVNNTFVGNQVLPNKAGATTVHPVISAVDLSVPKTNNGIDLIMKNNLFVDNIREGFPNDMDLYIDPDDIVQTNKSMEIRNDPNWPTVFELNVGEEYTLVRDDIVKPVKLISFEEFFQPYSKAGGDIYDQVKVVVEVDGTLAELWCRPYELPKEVNGVNIYVEVTKNWAHIAQYGKMPEVSRDVRFSAVLSGESWGPSGNIFPIQDYRFHSASYNNTWNQYVSYSTHYYHRGDDYGAIPDSLSVVTSYDGIMTVIGNGEDSNPFYTMYEGGVDNRMSHMNIYTCNTDLQVGQEVPKGTYIGKTGSTYRGDPTQQKHDHHFHYSFEWNNTTISTYPTLIQGYFNSYPDDVLAIAGGFQYSIPGREMTLDGSRSVARPGRTIKSYQWKLHDGTIVNDSITTVVYTQPGLYSEELIVEADNGSIDKNYLQVIVSTSDLQTNNIWGHFYYHPSREIYPGTVVTFANKLRVDNLQIDFGDGTPPQAVSFDSRSKHAYAHPGIYTVKLSGNGKNGEPAAIQLRLVVKPTP